MIVALPVPLTAAKLLPIATSLLATASSLVMGSGGLTLNQLSPFSFNDQTAFWSTLSLSENRVHDVEGILGLPLESGCSVHEKLYDFEPTNTIDLIQQRDRRR